VEIGMDIFVEIMDENDNPIEQSVEYELTNGTGETIKGESSEVIEESDVIPGTWEIIVTRKEGKA
jgi:hypothetical protein